MFRYMRFGNWSVAGRLIYSVFLVHFFVIIFMLGVVYEKVPTTFWPGVRFVCIISTIVSFINENTYVFSLSSFYSSSTLSHYHSFVAS